MKKALFLLYFSLFLCAESLFAISESIDKAPQRTDTHLYGHVVRADNGEHLAYVSVSLQGTTFGTVTDATGHYFIKDLPLGHYHVEVSMLGFQTQVREVDLKARQSVELNFEIREEAMQVDEVVVSASRTEVTRRESPSLVSVLNAKSFETVGATCLADGLSYQPGVRVEDNCQNCAFTQVRINGLDGHYSQILMDSRPIFSALTGVYGLEQIPTTMIDRVEVVRGGGSALFGASAIGGTINIITKDPVRSSGEFSHTLMSVGGSGSLSNNTTLNASLVTPDNKAGLLIYGQQHLRDGYDADGDGFTELPKLRSRTLGFRSFLRTGDYSRLSVQYHTIGEFRRGGDRLDLPPHQAQIAEQTDHSINGGGVSYDLWSSDERNRMNLFFSFQNTSRESYYGSHQDTNAYGSTHDLVLVSGGQYTHKWEKLWFMPAELVAGMEFNYNALEDKYVGYSHDTRQRVRIWSGYLQNEWRTEKWGFLLGARLDKHNLIDKAVISPRVNVRFNPSRQMNFRVSYSTGFRAPQAFDEDFHVAIVGGERVVTVLAPGLRQESSQSVSLSADLYHTFGRVQTNLLIEGFFTDLKDVFALREIGLDSEGNKVMERYNGSGARVVGGTIEGKAQFSPRFQLQAGITLQKSRYKEPEQWSDNPQVAPVTRLFRTPDSYGYFTATLTPAKRFNVALTGTYTGRMVVQHLVGSGTDVDTTVTTPAFFDMNGKLSYDFSLLRYCTLQLFCGVKNIFNAYQKDFDQGVERDSGYVYGPSLPRSYYVGVKFNF